MEEDSTPQQQQHQHFSHPPPPIVVNPQQTHQNLCRTQLKTPYDPNRQKLQQSHPSRVNRSS